MPTKYGTSTEVEGYKETVAQINEIQSNPYLMGQIADVRELKNRKKTAETQIEQRQAPAPKDDNERESLRQRQTLLEGFIKLECNEVGKPAMPSQHEMWETPAGAVGKHSLWEDKVKRYTLDPNGNPVLANGYGAIFEWKDNQRRLRGEDEGLDRDIANVEQLRPQNADKSSFADYRKIVTAGSPLFKAKYDEAFPDHTPTPVEAKIARQRCGKPKANGEPCGNFVPCRHHAQVPQQEAIPEQQSA